MIAVDRAYALLIAFCLLCVRTGTHILAAMYDAAVRTSLLTTTSMRGGGSGHQPTAAKPGLHVIALKRCCRTAVGVLPLYHICIRSISSLISGSVKAFQRFENSTRFLGGKLLQIRVQ